MGIRHSRYRRLLGQLRFYELAFLINCRIAPIRHHILQTFWNKLRDHKLPSHYACILPLVALDSSKKIRDIYLRAVQKYFARMRKETNIRSAKGSHSAKAIISSLPEYLLFYLIHLLSNYSDFDMANEQMFGSVFDFYFDALLKGTKSNQFPLLLAILNKIDNSFDVFSPLAKRHRYLLRIAMKKIKKRYKGKKFEDFPGYVPLPKALYKAREKSPNRKKKQKQKQKQAENESDHASDNEVMADMDNLNVSIGNDKSNLFAMSDIHIDFDDSIIDKSEHRIVENVSASGAEADIDDETQSATTQRRKVRNIGKKRKRKQSKEEEELDEENEDGPPKKKAKSSSSNH